MLSAVILLAGKWGRYLLWRAQVANIWVAEAALLPQNYSPVLSFLDQANFVWYLWWSSAVRLGVQLPMCPSALHGGHELSQTLGLWDNWPSWGSGKTGLFFTSSPSSIVGCSCSKIIFRETYSGSGVYYCQVSHFPGCVCSSLVPAARRLQLFPCPFREFIMLLHMPSYGKGHCSSNRLDWNSNFFLANISPDLKLCGETTESLLSFSVGQQCWSLSSVPLKLVSMHVWREGKGEKYLHFGYVANIPSLTSTRSALFPGDLWAGQCRCCWWCDFHCRTRAMS